MSSDNILEKSPEPYDAFDSSRHHAAKWYALGRELSVNMKFRSGLRDDLHSDDDDKLEQVLHKWIESEVPSWEKLLKAHYRVNTDSLRAGLEYLHQPDIMKKYSIPKDNDGPPPPIVVTQIDNTSLTVGVDLVPIAYLIFGVIDWFSLGQKLGMPSSELKNISCCDHTNGIIKMVVLWLETGSASWRVLAQALISLNRKDLARKISKKYPVYHPMPADNEDIHVHVKVFKRAIREKGSLTCYMVQCMPFGPPRVGKTCLYHRLHDQQPPGIPSTRNTVSNMPESTNVLTERKIIKTNIALESPQSSAKASVHVAQEKGKWKEIGGKENEIALFMKNIENQNVAKCTHIQASEVSSTVPIQSCDTVSSNGSQTPYSDPENGHLNSVVNAITHAVKGGNVDMSKVQADLDKSLTIFYTDVGGQPEFQEVLPALVAGPTVFLLVFNLSVPLDSSYHVKYESSQNKFKVHESSFTVSEVLMQCLSSMASYHDARNSFHPESEVTKFTAPPTLIMMLGTHRDLIEDQAIIDGIDQVLRKSLRDTALVTEGVLEYCNPGKSLVIPVDNYDPSDGQKLRDAFERAVRRKKGDISPYKVELPVPWLALELYLRQSDCSTISLTECMELAKTLNIPAKDLESCLWYLHNRIGTVRYYSNVEELRDTVITKPVVIFAAVTEFITSTFIPEHSSAGSVLAFKELGLFKTSEAKQIFNKHASLMEFEMFIALLKHLNILGPTFDKEFDFFLPCALAHAPLADEKSPASYDPFLIAFKSGFLPKGVFSGMLAFLSRRKWKIMRDGNKRPLLFRDQATFYVENEKRLATLRAKPEHLEFSLDSKGNGDSEWDDGYPNACFNIRRVLMEGIKDVCEKLGYGKNFKDEKFGFYCTIPECENLAPHFAEVDEQNKQAKCSVKHVDFPLEKKRRFWFTSIHQGIPDVTDEDIQKAKQEIHRVFTQTHRPRGIAFVVGIFDPDGTYIDIKGMESTFHDDLRFAVYRIPDPTCAELASLVKAAAEYEYPITCKFIAFYFAGHGGIDDKGREFVIPRKLKGNTDIMLIDHNILGPFRSRKNDLTPLKNGERRPYLFFFDCCLSQADVLYAPQNLCTFRLQNPLPNSIIAFATSAGLKSQGDKLEGGLWTRFLKKNLTRVNEPLVKILSNTQEEVSDELKERRKTLEEKYGDTLGWHVLEKLKKLVNEEKYQQFDEELANVHQLEAVSKMSFIAAYTPQAPRYIDSSVSTVYLNKKSAEVSSNETPILNTSHSTGQQSRSDSTDDSSDTILYSWNENDLRTTRSKRKKRKKSEDRREINLRKRRKNLSSLSSVSDEQEEDERESDQDYEGEDSSTVTESSDLADCPKEDYSSSSATSSSRTSESSEDFSDEEDISGLREDQFYMEKIVRKRRRERPPEDKALPKRKKISRDIEHSAYWPPPWLKMTMLQPSPYFPQEGDIVVYFYQGHELYCKEVKKEKLYKLTHVMPWDKCNLKAQESCSVRKVCFIVGPPTLCEITLALLSPTSDQDSGSSQQSTCSTNSPDTFTFTYHDMKGVPDFLILDSVYKCSIQNKWNPGDHFKSYMDRSYWRGTVVNREDSEGFPNSYWQCYNIKWKDGSDEYLKLSPWEMEPVSEEEDEEEMATEGTPRFIYPLTVEDPIMAWGGEGEQERIIKGLEIIMEMLEESEMFNNPVDLKEYEDYCTMVPFPTDLSTILERLKNGFYRRKRALIWEVNVLHKNAHTYNKEDSEIVEHSRILKRLLIKFIRSYTCSDPMEFYHIVTSTAEELDDG